MLGGIFVWRSLDAGNNWAFRGGTHGDIHELGYHPVDNKLPGGYPVEVCTAAQIMEPTGRKRI
ncbi:MAG: hypothetical protein IPL50_17420 [Chitinophagaceae bacterium]|nr:hypothetical protein [Chitinophagaceae bacterium]